MEKAPQWILGIAVVLFDVDVGPRIDLLEPEGILSKEEQAAISFHAFPDSMSMELHAKTSIKDTSFLFRIPRLGKAPKPQPPSASQGFLHGFVFCRQRQDNSLRRGGEQLSVVVLSEFPFSSPLTPLSQVAGPLYFSMGAPALKQVYQEVTTSWPPPMPGPLLQLPVGFTTLTCRLPPYSSLPYPSCQTTFDVPLPSSRTSVSRSSTNHSSLQDASTLPRGTSPPSFSPAQGRSKTATMHTLPSPPSLRPLSVPSTSQPQASSSQALYASTGADAGEAEAQGVSRGDGEKDGWGVFSWLGRDKARGGADEGQKEALGEESKHSSWLSGGWFGGEDSSTQGPSRGRHEAGDGEEEYQDGGREDVTELHAPGIPGFPLDAERDAEQRVGAGLLSQGSWPVPAAAAGVAGEGGLFDAAVPDYQKAADNKHGGIAAGAEEQDASKAGGGLHNGGPSGVSPQGSGEVEGGLGSIGRSFFGSGLFSSVGSLGSAEYPPAQRHSTKSLSGRQPSLEPVPQPPSALSSVSSHGSLAPEGSPQLYTQQLQQQQHLASLFKQQQQQPQQQQLLLPAGSSSSLPPSLPLSGAASLQTPSQSQYQGHGPSTQGGNVPVVVRRLSVGLQDPSSHASGPPGPFQEADVFGPFAAQLDKLWHLWEMVLLGKPLMVFGPSPTDCSWTVAALLSLIAPIPFAYDFRPYYTIHDSAFVLLAKGVLPSDPPHLQPQSPHSSTSAPKSASPALDSKTSHSGGISSSSQAGQQGSAEAPQETEEEQEGVDFGAGPQGVPCLFGVTNLFFVKALTHWPSILAINGRSSSNMWATSGKDHAGAPAHSSSISSAVKAIRARSQGSQALLSGHMEALWSQYRPITRPDHKLLARLLQPKPGDIKSKVARIAFVNNGAIHRHFHDLTTGLLQPLQRFIELGPDGWLPVWDPEAFLHHLKATQAASVPAVVSERVTSTSALLELYSRLLASANFRTWLAIHRQPYLHLLAPPSKPLTSVTSDTFNFNSDEEGDVLVVAAGGPKNVQEGSKRVGGEAWFAHAREHMDEVEFINLFFTQEQLLREAQSSAYAFASPNAEELVARLRSELVNLLLGINQRDLQLICISAPQRKALLLEISRDLSPSQQKTIQDLCAELDD